MDPMLYFIKSSVPMDVVLSLRIFVTILAVLASYAVSCSVLP